MEFIARAPADGYTLYYADSGPLTVAPHLGKVGYDSLASFTHLGHVCGSGSLLVVHPSTPFNSVADVVATSKREPAKWSYGTSGVGGPHHLSGEYFKSATGASLLHVPYKGGGPALADTIAGQVPLLFLTAPAGLPSVRSGKLRALAVSTLKRTAAAPEIPTVSEELNLPDYEVDSWVAMFAPAKTPEPIVARMHKDLSRVLQLPEVKQRLLEQSADPVGSSPQELGRVVGAELKRWAVVIGKAGIKPE